ncbi:MAG: GNAT family N-acetyltransferase [Spirochaetales bacterium]|nr:GNAT family N-acetyltransferase [Spirochaetales bacterium]
MPEKFTLEWKSSITDIPQEDWDSLAAVDDMPFYEWHWLRLLESSGSIHPINGWTPVHATVWHGSRLVACAPLYEKTHSMGEFVYDFALADVARQLNVAYYPKLVGTSPATPSGSYRLFHHPDYPGAADFLLSGLVKMCGEKDMGGLSFLFVQKEWIPVMALKGFHEWKHQAFLWTNRGFSGFGDYLALFSKGQRRNIRKELASVENQGVSIRPVWIEDTHSDQRRFLYDMYDNTNSRFGPWAARFLTPDFFYRLNEGGKRRILLFLAEASDTGESLAVSVVVVKDRYMFGRYWGSKTFVKDLHFVLCYYEPIRYAIEHGIDFFDPGAGSPHKLRRGFEAVSVSSLHWFSAPVMNDLFRRYMPQINEEEMSHIEDMNRSVPLASPAIQGGDEH